MAANPKVLRVVANRRVSPSAHAVEVECISGGPFDDVGGKYAIIHFAGVTLASDPTKPVKRAYSLVPVDGKPGYAEIFVQRRGEGPGSNALADAKPESTFTFSGPWGKLVPETGLHERTLLVATDTGVTSAMSIVEKVRTGGGHRPLALLWFRRHDDDFLESAEVEARVARAGVPLEAHRLRDRAPTEVVEHAHSIIELHRRAAMPSLIIATGDGSIVHPLIAKYPELDVRIESYFRNPDKKIGA